MLVLPRRSFVNFPTPQQILPPTILNKFDVSIELCTSRIVSGKYVFTFFNMINYNGLQNIALPLNMGELKNKLERCIVERDKKYIKLNTYDRQKSTFVFQADEWLKDALNGVKGVNSFGSLYNKEFKLKAQLPAMLSMYGMRLEMVKHVAAFFKDYLKRKPEAKKALLTGIPAYAEKMINLKPEEMYDYSYDYMSNKVIAQMKAQYVMIITYGAMKLALDVKKPFGVR
jgi:hypothetical protein